MRVAKSVSLKKSSPLQPRSNEEATRLLQLIAPDATLEVAFRALAEEFRSEPERFWRYSLDRRTFAEYLAGLRQRALSRAAWTFPHTPEQTFWLLDGAVGDGAGIVGVSRLRFELRAEEAWFDGHIGLEIRPSRRREGLGVELLRQTCAEAGRRGVRPAILTVLAANVASCRTIVRCGGHLLGTVPDRDGALLCRFSIQTG